MAPPPLVSLRDVFVTFGGRPLFTGVTCSVGRGEKACLVGRNGSGKSTLLKVMAGQTEADSGEVFVQPGARVAYLPQDPTIDGATIADHVAAGLPESERAERHRALAVLARLGLDGGRSTAGLSGGEGRRAALARALVGEPDVLLLDEPTNHLDLPAILWLEEELAAFGGALVVISHDRAFLTRISRSTLWLDRGVVRMNDQGFGAFEAWQEQILAAEEAELARIDKRLEAETHWLHRGVTARRRRNMGRLRALMSLRAERAGRLKLQGSVTLDVDSGAVSGKLVAVAEAVSKSYGGRMVIRDFSTRVQRGDRVGIIGPNGAGKTTLLRLLTGDLEPDAGRVRLGTNLEAAYYDQRRSLLDPAETVWRSLTGGSGDSVPVRGRPRHVVSYMRDFLFEDRQAHSPVSALSGGERSRLALAMLLARPSNLMILDEPTNDLDMDTLDLLEEALAEYDGTLLVVSHDRDFLDRLATSVIIVEGDGTAREYAGGYTEAMRQRSASGGADRGQPRAEAKALGPARATQRPTRLSFKEQREADELPARMDKLGAEARALEAALADPALYARDQTAFAATAARLEAVRAELAGAEERWLDLELKREELARGRP